eukprot:jgi/Orpsp1_1/1182217/evm.model.c7180000080365.1
MLLLIVFKEKLIVPIVAKCQRIQNEMLKVVDNDLYIALKKHEIEPQLYGLRWLRLLFSREFPIKDVLILWDGIFAEGGNLELVDWIVLVMLMHIRDKIINQEYSSCLTSLMKYPKLEQENEIVLFVENARRLKANWVELLAKNNEQQHNKENLNFQNKQNKMNKIQSIIKSADKRLSWTGYDSHKNNKNINIVSSSSNNIDDYKYSLHEKQQKIIKIKKLKTILKSKIIPNQLILILLIIMKLLYLLQKRKISVQNQMVIHPSKIIKRIYGIIQQKY